MWSVWLVFCDCGFHSVYPLMDKSNMETHITIYKIYSCIAQETQTGALYKHRGVGWGGRWEGRSKARRYMYTYGWFRFDRKQNSVKQLSSIKKHELKKEAKQNFQKSIVSRWWLFLETTIYQNVLWFIEPVRDIP